MMNALQAIRHSTSVQETIPVVQSKQTQETPKTEQETRPNQDVYVPEKSNTAEDTGAVYTKNAALVNQLKSELAEVQSRFLSSVRDMLTKQGKEISGEGVWKVLASGDFTVDAETQAGAKQAISEEGYWGVKQTSQRIVNFAKALVGGDPSRIEEMKEAFLQGYAAAEESWGGALPDISGQTKEAVLELFDAWAKEETEEQTTEACVPNGKVTGTQ